MSLSRLRAFVALALGTAAVTSVTIFPRATFAEVVPDSERYGEWDEGGTKFGNVVVNAALVPDATGWVLRRTVENRSDAPETLRVEERVLETKTMPEARVEPPPSLALVRSVTLTLGPHEKRVLGVRLSPELSEKITTNLRRKSSIELRRGLALEREDYRNPVLRETYLYYRVEYLTPLPLGATAERWDNGVTEPATMPYLAMPTRPVAAP